MDKVFKVSPSSYTKRAAEGEIINYLEEDSNQLGEAIMLSPFLFIAPIQIIVYAFWLFDFLGISFIFGLSTLIIFLVINLFIQIKMQKYVTKILKARDERMKVISETFNSIKLLKLYGWEREFLKRVFSYIKVKLDWPYER